MFFLMIKFLYLQLHSFEPEIVFFSSSLPAIANSSLRQQYFCDLQSILPTFYEYLFANFILLRNTNTNLCATTIFETPKYWSLFTDQRYNLYQWFSTFGCWRPTKQKNTLFGDPYVTIIVLEHRFWRTKSKREPSTQMWVATHLLRNTDLYALNVQHGASKYWLLQEVGCYSVVVVSSGLIV